MLQVQTVGVGVHKGEQGQAAANDEWKRRRPLLAVWEGGTGHAVLLWKRRGRIFRATWRDGARAGVEEAGVNHPSSVGSGSEAGGLDASAGNIAGVGGALIQADGAE